MEKQVGEFSEADYKNASPADKRRIQTAVVERYRDRVAQLVRRLVPSPRHCEEGTQVGLLGVLVALEKYDPARHNGTPFWAYARFHVLDEVEMWLGRAVFWRPSTKRAKGRSTAWQERAVMTLSDQIERVGDDESSPEHLYEQAELAARLRTFLNSLSDDDRTFLVRETRNRFCSVSSRRYLSLVERAAAFVRGKDDVSDQSGVPTSRH